MIKNNLYNNSLKYVKIISILIVISLLFDVLVYVEGAESNLSYFKGVIVYGYLIIVLLRYNILKLDTSNNIVLLLILYWMCLIFFSSDIMLSFKMYTKIVAPLIVYVFTSNLYPNNKHFKYIYISFSCVIIISVLYGIISNFLGLKDSYAMKREAIETYSIGLGDGKLYAQSIAIIIFPILLLFSFLINTFVENPVITFIINSFCLGMTITFLYLKIPSIFGIYIQELVQKIFIKKMKK
ncbi:MAG: hypothetical protein R2760_06795 [Chitinophagales bacterium]